MEALASRVVDLAPVSHQPTIVLSATIPFPVAVPDPVPEPAKPCPIVQRSNIVAVSEITPRAQGQTEALPLVH